MFDKQDRFLNTQVNTWVLLISRLKINLSKSMLVGVGCSEEHVRLLADRLHCKIGHLPILYLGLPIGANPRFKKV